MTISFEQAVDTLQAMFPAWDREALSALLIANNGHVENTIESIFNIDNPSSAAPAPMQQPMPPPQSVPNQQPTSRAFNSFPPQPPSAFAAPAARSQHSQTATQPNRGQYRGKRCRLPENFLAIPGNFTLADEQLAILLQDELFQREVEAMGYSFSNNRGRPVQGQVQQQQHQNQHPGQQQHQQYQQQQQQQQQQSTTSPAQSAQGSSSNSSIMKSLSTMGEAAKRNLSLMAMRFRRGNNSNSNNNSNTNSTGIGSEPQSTPASRYSMTSGMEMRPLVAADDEDDETEVINFDQKSSRGGRGNHYLDDDFSEENEDLPILGTNKMARRNQ